MAENIETVQGTSLWKDAWWRLLKNKLAVFGLIVMTIMVIAVIIGPAIIRWATGFTADQMPSEGNLLKSFPPSLQHPMGTDESGRDMLARVLQGGRISLMVGVISTIVSLIVGVSYGAIAGYLGGKIDNIMMRIVDIIYAIPYILIVIVLLQAFRGNNTEFLIQLLPVIIVSFVMLLGLAVALVAIYRKLLTNPGINQLILKIGYAVLTIIAVVAVITLNYYFYQWFLSALGASIGQTFTSRVGAGLSQIFLLFFSLGLVSWLTMARVVRGQILSLKNQEFVTAARATGVSTPNIIFRHLVPNALGPVIVYATLTIPSVMLTEAFLSFLGLGVQAPYASWGSLASDGIKNIAIYPWQLIFPGVTMALTLFSLNFLGDGLRDALDPQTRKF
jgi:oligopeptide transport system permease protein